MSSNNRVTKSVAIPLKEFLKKSNLPKVVRLVSSEESGPETTVIDRILLYKHHNVTRTEAYVDGGHVVIPHTFKGWFSLVTERRQIKAVCFPIVYKLIQARVTTFLTLTDLIGYKLYESKKLDGIKQHYVKTTVHRGATLRILGVYKDVNHIPTPSSTPSKRLSWPSAPPRPHQQEVTHYAECQTEADEILYVKLSASGEFYAVDTRQSSVSTEDKIRRVYQLPELLRNFPLPVRVCVIDGNQLQGSLVLERTRTDEVVFCSTVSSSPRLLELDVATLRLLVAPPVKRYSTEKILSSERLITAFRLCELHGDEWCRQMKMAGQVVKCPSDDGGGSPVLEVKQATANDNGTTHSGGSNIIIEPSYRRVRDSIEDQIYCEVKFRNKVN